MASEAERALEAILMVADEAVAPHLLAQILEVSPTRVEELCSQLALSYAAEDRGFVLLRIGGGYRFQSHPDLAPYVERFVLEGQSSRLSAAALETMAIVAYKQPVSRAQVSSIRGVNVDGVMRTLQQRGLIDEVGLRPGPGQAVLYGTTVLFLEKLGLDSLDQLPSLAEFVPGAEVMDALEQGLRHHDIDPRETPTDTDEHADTSPDHEISNTDISNTENPDTEHFEHGADSRGRELDPQRPGMSEVPDDEDFEDDRPAFDDSHSGERLQKVLAKAGIGSRRVCEELIADGRVTVDGEVAELGRHVEVDTDAVAVDGIALSVRPGLVYYLLNKPTGVVTTSADPQGRPTVVDLVPDEPRIFSVGRLDIDTEGLLVLTNDGDLAHRLTHPRFGVEKEYLAIVAGIPTPADVRRLREGVELEDGMTAPAKVSLIEPNGLRVVIHEGRNRQVRRMCDFIGHPVIRLVRSRIGPIADRRLAPGEWRSLTPAEVRSLETAAAASEPKRPRPPRPPRQAGQPRQGRQGSTPSG